MSVKGFNVVRFFSLCLKIAGLNRECSREFFMGCEGIVF